MGQTHTELLRSKTANPGKKKWFIYTCEAIPLGSSLQEVRKQRRVNTRTGILFLHPGQSCLFHRGFVSAWIRQSYMLCSRHISTKLIIYWNQGTGRSSLSYIQAFLFVMRTLPPSLSPRCCSPSASELGQTRGSAFAKKAHQGKVHFFPIKSTNILIQRVFSVGSTSFRFLVNKTKLSQPPISPGGICRGRRQSSSV